MTTTRERTPKHGYTLDGIPVHAKTRDYFKKDTAMQRFNAAVGLRITVLVGTMWCAYVFGAIALVSLPDNVHSKQLLILWISSSFLQLVLLPIIIVGQNIQARASDARAAKTFEDVLDVRRKIEHAIRLLDVHTEGGLHDAVELIVDAINAKGSGTPSPAAP
ncbi:MAG TPA: hypothetical protein VG244_07630 [Acidimicrobiales bacterium]|jgi:hypothetical protein|nr:hypothetical protein [Acidimicrobiales bacterium]